MTTAIDVSLLICTRDRHASLAATLESVELAAVAAVAAAAAAAAERAIAIEVILVDNGSTDGSPDLMRRWQAKQRFPVRLVHEPRPGLAHARNAGLARRRGAIVAMTDDDCVLHTDYFTALVAAFATAGPRTIIGGRILLGDPADLVVTVKLEDHPMIAAPEKFPGGFVMGANLAFRTDVLAEVGAFDDRFGAGAPFVAGEDTDILFRASGLGIQLRYDPTIMVDHHHGRRHPDQETQLLAGYSFADGALYAKHLLTDGRILRAILGDLLDLRLDVLRPVTTHAGIRRFYLFRLRHKLRGFIAYLRRARRSPAAD